MKFRFEDIAVNSVEKRKPTLQDQNRYIGLEHLESGNFDVPSWGSKTPLKGDKLVMRKGDFLFGKRRTYLRRVAIAPFDGIFSAHGMILRPNKQIVDERFFPFFLASDYFMKEAIRISVGSLSPTINWKDLKELEFNLPPIEEQARIADLLWAMNDTKKAYRNLLAATDELVKARFVEMFGDLNDNSNNWEQSNLGTICDVRDGTHDSPCFYNEGYPLITSKNVTSGTIDFSNCNYISESDFDKINKRSKVDIGDIIMPMIGTVGFPVIVDTDRPFAIKNVLLIKFLEASKVNNIFIKHLLESDYFRWITSDVIRGGNQKFISLGEMRKLIVCIPPMKIQQRFSEFVHDIETFKEKLIQTLSDIQSLSNNLLNRKLS